VEALVHHYQTERAKPGDDVMVGFFGGPVPDDALLAACGDLPFAVRVRPDLLSRGDADRLVAAGALAIEVDALTLDDHVLRQAGRRYPAALVEQILEGLQPLGVRVGIVLAPGLPGSTYDSCLHDARHSAPLIHTARLHPVLVLEHSRLQQRHIDGLYTPLLLGEAVTVCRGMMDLLEDAGVEVIRVGLQPGPDGVGRALAGPVHPSLRELVEARRVREQLIALLDGTPPRSHIVIRCAPQDVGRTRGPFNQHIRDLRALFDLEDLDIHPDPDLLRGHWAVDLEEP
jgi:hypothetical protein